MTISVEDIINAVDAQMANENRPVAETLGEALQEARVMLCITQREAADMLDTSQARISGAERGEWDPKLSTILKYAEGYGYDIEINLIPHSD
jgi:transcriptional regulator with XRE-family HTH domain